jgi:oxygen-dependent protoporphyrinogen oxidase
MSTGRPRRDEAPRRVVVLGGGITGLAAAWEATRLAQKDGRPAQVTVLEGSERAGGKIRTESLGGTVIETGPDSFITTKPDMLELVKELGLEGDLIGTAGPPTVSVLLGGRLVPMPEGMSLAAPTRLLPFALSPLFTSGAKLRMAFEPLVPTRRGGDDESLADFTRRRLGPEALERLVGPMLAGIYAGDPERLSVKSTFPQLVEMEKKGGLSRSLWLGGAPRAAAKGGFTTFMTLKSGLSGLVDALLRRLPPGTVKLDHPAQAVRRHGGEWEVVTPHGRFAADAVVCALPAPAAADALEGADPELAHRLREIPFVSTATATYVWDEKSLPRTPRGFGLLAPRREGLAVTAATFSSSKFPGRATPGRTVVRAFLGGAGREEAAEMAVTRVEETARRELDGLLGLGGVKPLAAKATRWIKSNPQYNVGHAERLERLSSCLKSHPGLTLAGSSYTGVGLPDCVRSGRRAAARSLSLDTRRSHAELLFPGLA